MIKTFSLPTAGRQVADSKLFKRDILTKSMLSQVVSHNHWSLQMQQSIFWLYLTVRNINKQISKKVKFVKTKTCKIAEKKCYQRMQPRKLQKEWLFIMFY